MSAYLNCNRDRDFRLCILKSTKIRNIGNQVLYWVEIKDGNQFDTIKEFIKSLNEKDILSILITLEEYL